MKKRDEKEGRLVYSTAQGRICPECGQPASACVCRRAKKPVVAGASAAKSDGVVRLSLDTKGRKGKGVTLLTGVPLTGEALRQLAKQLKQRCGSGGTVKEGAIEIQGDHREAIERELTQLGYRVKRLGG